MTILGYICRYLNEQQKPLSHGVAYKWGRVDLLELPSHSVKKTASFVKTNSDSSDERRTTLRGSGDVTHPLFLSEAAELPPFASS